MDRPDRHFLREAWRLARPYWRSEERWRARLLLGAIVVLNLLQVYLNVRFNRWQGDFFNGLQQYRWHVVVHQSLLFVALATVFVIDAVYALYLNQMLQLRWRRWMTERYLADWLANRAYYRMQLIDTGTDNPDQRIAEDLRDFASIVLSLGLGGLNSAVTLASFLAILWQLSGVLVLPLGPLGHLAVPGYAVWAALIYAVLGTWAASRIGRPLVGLYFGQQRREADFRYGLIRLRENAESVAFFGGEASERARLEDRFGGVFDNFLAIMRQQKRLSFLTAGYNQAAQLVPLAIAVPRYFGHALQIGGVQRLADAFTQVQTALSFVVNSYTDFASLHAIVDRLAGFRLRIDAAAAAAGAPPGLTTEPAADRIALDGLCLALPNGAILQENIEIEARRGSRLLLMGPSGAGKSTLLRAIAGLWPFASGRIRRHDRHPMFLPQRPYLPQGSLREVVLYPDGAAGIDDPEIRRALAAVGLERLAEALDEVDNWAWRLSAGEQQRLNFARVLLRRPDAVFLDEATSALDEAAEAALYRLLAELPSRPTVISVGHRSTLKPFHDRVIELAAAGAGASAAAE